MESRPRPEPQPQTATESQPREATPSAERDVAARFGRGPFLRGLWYLAAESRQVRAGRTLAKELLGEPVLLGRTRDGRPFALRDFCPHRGMPLRHGTFDGESIRCCYHGWTFAPDGRCTEVPALTPDSGIDVERIRVRSYPCRDVQGNIWVFFDDGKRADADAPPPVPAVSFDDSAVPTFRITLRIPTHADHAVYALVDPAHIASVHGLWWFRKKRALRRKEKHFEPCELGFRMARHQVSTGSTRLYRLFGSEVTSQIDFLLPGIRVEDIRGDRNRLSNVLIITPINADECDLHACMYSTMGWMRAIRPLGERMMRTFLGQDRDVATWHREGLAHDPPLMLLGDPDGQGRWYEKLKAEWAQARAESRDFRNPIEPQTLRWMS